VTRTLAALVRKSLIRPDKPQLPGEDGFRFGHALLQEVAYEGITKSKRAELHERLAAWLDERGADFLESDEIVGYHLEQAWRYSRELGGPENAKLAAEAREHLTAAGRRAFSRQDYSAAVKLLKRANALVPEDAVDRRLEVNLVAAVGWSGNFEEAARYAQVFAERAATVGNRLDALCARIQERINAHWVRPIEGAAEQLSALVDDALPLFEANGDDLALVVAYRARGQVAEMQSQMGAALRAYEQGLVHARRAGFPIQLLIAWCARARFVGATPASELLAWQDELDELVRRNPWVRSHRASALTMIGRIEEGRAVLAEGRAEIATRGGVFGVMCAHAAQDIAFLVGDFAGAAAAAEERYRRLQEIGITAFRSSTAAYVGQAYCELGRHEAAIEWATRAANFDPGLDEGLTQMLWRQVRAKVLAQRGEHAEAEELAREAVALGEQTDFLDAQGDAYADLAQVLAMTGRSGDAAAALEQALARYERKENVVVAERVRARLAELPS
jgi:tetratricopeptide (TPR) repeat protein